MVRLGQTVGNGHGDALYDRQGNLVHDAVRKDIHDENATADRLRAGSDPHDEGAELALRFQLGQSTRAGMNLLAAVQAAHEFHQNVMRPTMDGDNLGCNIGRSFSTAG